MTLISTPSLWPVTSIRPPGLSVREDARSFATSLIVSTIRSSDQPGGNSLLPGTFWPGRWPPPLSSPSRMCFRRSSETTTPPGPGVRSEGAPVEGSALGAFPALSSLGDAGGTLVGALGVTSGASRLRAVVFKGQHQQDKAQADGPCSHVRACRTRLDDARDRPVRHGCNTPSLGIPMNRGHRSGPIVCAAVARSSPAALSWARVRASTIPLAAFLSRSTVSSSVFGSSSL
jgi:hypothetical protein